MVKRNLNLTVQCNLVEHLSGIIERLLTENMICVDQPTNHRVLLSHTPPTTFCIASLEQRNEELQVEVVRLKTNLVQQRHWYQAVQVKIVESEKVRAAAELRNATLQREMEQLFDTFGELNNEAKKTEYIVKSF